MFVSHIVIYEWFALQISLNLKSLFLDLISRFEASRLEPHADQDTARAFSTVSKCSQMTVPGKGADFDMRVLRHASVLATSSSHSHSLVVLLLISLGLSLSPSVFFIFLSLSLSFSLCLYLLLLFLPLSVPLSLARLFSLTFLISPLFLSLRTMLRLVLKA